MINNRKQKQIFAALFKEEKYEKLLKILNEPKSEASELIFIEEPPEIDGFTSIADCIKIDKESKTTTVYDIGIEQEDLFEATSLQLNLEIGDPRATHLSIHNSAN